MKDYREWQTNLYDLWVSNRLYGCVKARTGAGKTLAGVSVVDRYTKEHPDNSIVVVVPSRKLISMWESTFKEQDVPIPDIVTYIQLMNRINKGDVRYDCMVLDECHRVSPEKRSSQVLNVCPLHILGLSATPDGSVMTLGQPFYTVDWEESQLCPFTVHYARFIPNDYEMDNYNRWTAKMQTVAFQHTGGAQKSLPPLRNLNYDRLARMRRDCCYTMDSRITHAVNIIKRFATPERRMVVYAERNEQLRRIYDILMQDGIRCSVYSQWMDTLSDFESHDTNILLLCKMLREGWNDVTLNMEILVAPTTRELSHTQVVGRVQRRNPDDPDKHSHVICLIADGTSDESVIHRNDFPKDSVDVTTVDRIMDMDLHSAPHKAIEDW